MSGSHGVTRRPWLSKTFSDDHLMARLEKRVALLTGAASGIGRAAALAFAAEGARLALADINEEALVSLAAALRRTGAEVLWHAVDLCQPSAVHETVENVASAYGRIDVLFNNAGIDLKRAIEETSEEDWDRVMAVNVRSMFLLCKNSVPHMVRAGGGSIVNVSSAAALIPVAGRPAYVASKGAVVALSRSLALDLAPKNIRVNCICPGAVRTPLLLGDIERAVDPQAALAAVISRYPLRRLAEPEEVAQVVVFLASQESSYMTGATLAVDGGRTMH